MTVQEAAKVLLDGIRDPWHGDANIPGFADIDWQRVYDAMTDDHNESMEICGTPDWASLMITFLEEIVGEE